MNSELMKPYQARNVNNELGYMQDYQLNNPHLPQLFPTEYHSPHSLGLSDLAFLAQAQAVDAAVGGWVELARTTLGSPASTIDVSSLPDKRYYQVLIYYDDSIDSAMRFNGISTTTYANRRSDNGGADSTQVNQDKITINASAGGTLARFTNGYIANFDTKEKLALFFTATQQTAGAATSANRTEAVGKHAQTTNPIDQMTVVNTGGNFPIGAELVVLGWDPADVHTNNFWVELASDQLGSAGDLLTSGTIPARKYLWIQYYFKATGGNAVDGITFNNSTGTEYAERRSFNDGAEFTQVNRLLFEPNGGAIVSGNAAFVNLFMVNNSANDKLIIGHAVIQNTAGAANAPNRNEGVWKWDNTSAQITEVDIDNAQAGSYDVGSFLKVWGAN